MMAGAHSMIAQLPYYSKVSNYSSILILTRTFNVLAPHHLFPVKYQSYWRRTPSLPSFKSYFTSTHNFLQHKIFLNLPQYSCFFSSNSKLKKNNELEENQDEASITYEECLTDQQQQQQQQNNNPITEVNDVLKLENTIKNLKKELDDSKEKQKENHEKLLRALADNLNIRKRFENEKETLRHYSITKFAESILDVADNLELALQHATTQNSNNSFNENSYKTLVQGVEMTQVVLKDILKKFGIEDYDAIDEPFNPKLHEALFEIDVSEKTKGTIVEVLKRGYKIKGKVLRAAKVATAK